MTKPLDTSALDRLRAEMDHLTEAEAEAALAALERERDRAKVMAYVSGDARLDLKKLMREQNYRGTDHAKIARLAKEMDVQESVEDLLALLDE